MTAPDTPADAALHPCGLAPRPLQAFAIEEEGAALEPAAEGEQWGLHPGPGPGADVGIQFGQLPSNWAELEAPEPSGPGGRGQPGAAELDGADLDEAGGAVAAAAASGETPAAAAGQLPQPAATGAQPPAAAQHWAAPAESVGGTSYSAEFDLASSAASELGSPPAQPTVAAGEQVLSPAALGGASPPGGQAAEERRDAALAAGIVRAAAAAASVGTSAAGESGHAFGDAPGVGEFADSTVDALVADALALAVAVCTTRGTPHPPASPPQQQRQQLPGVGGVSAARPVAASEASSGVSSASSASYQPDVSSAGEEEAPPHPHTQTHTRARFPAAGEELSPARREVQSARRSEQTLLPTPPGTPGAAGAGSSDGGDGPGHERGHQRRSALLAGGSRGPQGWA